MAFLPKDIIKHQFSKALRGYDPIEVEAYLEVLAEKFTDIMDENRSLREKNETYETNFKEFEAVRNQFRNQQVNAQKDMKTLRVKAEKEAKIILMDAKLKAENIVNSAYKDMSKLRQEIDELKQLKSSFIVRFRTILRQQLDTLELYATDTRLERMANNSQSYNNMKNEEE